MRRIRSLMLALLSCVALINATNVIAQEAPLPSAKPQPVSSETAPKPAMQSEPPAEKSASPVKGGDEKPVEKPAEKAKNIALILPISSKSLGKAADAVKAGFIAAAETGGREKFTYRLYLAEDEGASLALLYRKAVQEGAVAVVAGITRDGATVVARESGYLPTLALNAPADLAKSDANNFFHISLSLDWEARLVARAAFQDGFRNVAIAVDSAALSKRIQDAFEKEWAKLGGTIVARVAFAGDPNDGPKMKTAMEKADAAKADVVFIAAEMQTARVTRPYLPQGLPVYATAQTFDPRAGAIENLDLDSVRYLEVPWFAEPDHAAVMSYARPPEGTPVDYERLYALGIDAWRVVLALVQGASISTISNVVISGDRPRRNVAPIDGVTGRIALDGNQFVRSLTLMEMRDGRPKMIRSAE